MNNIIENYEIPNIEKCIKQLNSIIYDISCCNDIKSEINLVYSFYDILKEILSYNSIITAQNLMNINSTNLTDRKYDFDKYLPEIQLLKKKLYKIIDNSKNKNALIDTLGEQYFKIIKNSLFKKLKPKYSSNISEDDLTNEYGKIIANSEITINNISYSLSELNILLLDKDIENRKIAYLEKLKFFSLNEKKINIILDSLIKLRADIAKYSGFNNYIDISYINMNRYDYTQKDIRKFRKYILNYVNPLITEIQEYQKKYLNTSHISNHNERYVFYDKIDIFSNKENFLSLMDKVFTDMSEETKELFLLLKNNDLIDVESRKGKSPGAYSIYIENKNISFIITNNSGTYEDILNFSHEFGHALQRRLSGKYKIIEYSLPTMELGEVSSMTMELLIYPFIDKYLKEYSLKYKYNHMFQAILFLPYVAAIDEFQEQIYSNLQLTIDERNILWQNIEKKYMPWRNYTEYEVKINSWQQQGHIIFSPFYYIDYALAQMTALEIWIISNNDRDKAWSKFINICKSGGSKSYLNTLKENKLSNIFIEENFKNIIEYIKTYMIKLGDQIERSNKL